MKSVRIRKFLNKPDHHSVAAIYAVAKLAESVGAEDDDREYYIDSYVVLSDCSRQVTLDTSCLLKKDSKNAIYKIDTIMDALAKVKAFIEEHEGLVGTKK